LTGSPCADLFVCKGGVDIIKYYNET
jgi:hypothetical protein